MSRLPPSDDTNKSVPSGVQTGLVLRCLSSVIRTGIPPSAPASQIDEGAMFPMFSPKRNGALFLTKATTLPSGDHALTTIFSPPRVNGTSRRCPPCASVMTNAPVEALVQATRSLLFDHEQTSRESSPLTICATPRSAGLE